MLVSATVAVVVTVDVTVAVTTVLIDVGALLMLIVMPPLIIKMVFDDINVCTRTGY